MKKWITRIALICGVLTLIICAWLWFKIVQHTAAQTTISAAPQTDFNPLFPSEMNEARYAKTEVVIGDLGGVPVKIPRHFAEFLEYDGDPGFGEKRKGSRPERTYQSKIASFGFDVRYPDKAGKSTEALRQDFKAQNIFMTTWFDVGIRAGDFYPGDGFIQYSTERVLTPELWGIDRHKQPEHHWVREPKLLHGLTVYYHPGVDPLTGKLWREYSLSTGQAWDAEDLFVYWDKSNKAIARISCSNRRTHSAPCRHHFSMEPDMKVEVYMSYRRGMLEHWREIQMIARETLLSFKVAPPTQNTPANPAQTKQP